MKYFIAKYRKGNFLANYLLNNEIDFLNHLSAKEFGVFKIVKLVSSNKYSIITEKIQSNNKGFGSIENKIILDSIFQLSLEKVKNKSNILFSPNVSIIITVIFLILRRKLQPLVFYLRTLIVYYLSTFSLKRKYLIHKDLSPRGRFHPNSFYLYNIIYIFDFETTTMTKRFFLSDIVDFLLLEKYSDFLMDEFKHFIVSHLEYYGISEFQAYQQVYILIARRLKDVVNNDNLYEALLKILNEIKHEYLQ
jgi:hypothetical protein